MIPHRVYIDAETFSSVDLSSRGLANYWDPEADTDMHCMAVKIDDGPIRLAKSWDDPILGELEYYVDTGALIVAHKAEFEFYLLRKLGFRVKLEQMRCTMAKAAAMAFPMSLGKLSLALGLPQGKDLAGQKAMKILCKPNPATDRHWRYEDDPKLFEDLYRYCIHDVQLEYDIDQLLPDLSEEEQAMWVLDQQINRRGIGVDRRAAAAAYEICGLEIQRLDREIREASGGAVDSTKAVLQIARFCGLPSVAKASIEEALDEPLDGNFIGAESTLRLSPAQRRVLQIRQEAAKSSVLKLKPMLELCGGDGRVRWTQQFNGAGTGRWSGRNPQPHNFPRGTLHLDLKDRDWMLDQLLEGRVVDAPGRPPRLSVISDLLRGMFVAAPGYEFSSYDFAQIEMRLGAWFVGDEGMLAEFNGEGKIYEMTYATSFGIEKSEVTKDQRQSGKVLALGAQFGGGSNALINTAKQAGVILSEKVAEDLKVRWRAAHPKYQHVWKAMETCAKTAIMYPGSHSITRHCYYHVPTAMDGTPAAVLQCTLPSGRVISYPFPCIERRTITKKDGTTWETDSLTYMVVENNQWVRTATYGGKLFENVVQAAAADLLRFGITNMNEAGIPVVLMVHDEVIGETPVGALPWSDGAAIMERRPDWCSDLPIKVTGWTGKRYRKE